MYGYGPEFFSQLYAQFRAPIATLNCGEKCAPYNQHGVPFCCDAHHAVPSAYAAEWEYLQHNTDLWRLWQASDPTETATLRSELPAEQVLIVCLGHRYCQRPFRSLTCRAFPFFPYLTSGGEFIGLSYYWDYEDRCWVISNLRVVTPEYRAEFVGAFDSLLAAFPRERTNFAHHAAEMRRIFRHRRRAIPLLHRDGHAYKITPHNERARRVPLDRLPKFGPYKIAAALPFPGEK